jgi:hypothetical protein
LVVPKLVELLKDSEAVTHQQLKAALYIIGFEKFCFFYNW